MKQRILIAYSVCLISPMTSLAQEGIQPGATTSAAVPAVPSQKAQAEKKQLQEQQPTPAPRQANTSTL